jgi:exopolyphosphatase / guanosine-5'-triphosphate,3'-diphosphate pyrophosphatase
MFAAVDLGSNSFRLHIGEHDGTAMRIVETARDPIRLAAGLDGKSMLTETAMQTALACLSNFRAILGRYQLDAVRVVATNTLRVARNAQEFLPRAEQAIGYPIEIISGEEEGRLIYMGVASQLAQPDEKRLVIDIGGGSTEIILGCGQDIRTVESFSIGTHRQSASFFPDGRINAASFDAAIMSARSYFEDAAPLYDRQHWSNAYGSSGTMRAIASVIAKNGIGDGTMSYNSLLALKSRLIEFRRVEAFDLPGVKEERVIVMVGGLAVLIGIMQELGIESLTTVNAGLRLGVLWDLQLRATKHDRRDQSVMAFMRRFQADEGRAGQVAAISAKLYAQLKPDSDAFGQYLHWSSLLHEVGLSISHTGAHKHSAYIVENADLPGFTTREQRVMSTLIVGQKGNLRKIAEALSDVDFSRAVLALRLAAMFMHSKIDADVDGLQLKMKNRIEIEVDRDWLERHPTVSYWLDKERDAWDEVGVPMSVKVG